MGLDHKSYLASALERNAGEDKKFITHCDVSEEIPEGAYVPGVPHFEIVESGELPLSLSGMPEDERCRLRPGEVFYLAPGCGVRRDADTTRELLVINLHSEGVECYRSRHKVMPDGVKVSRISYHSSCPLNYGGIKVLEAFEYHAGKTEDHMLLMPLFRIFLQEVRENLCRDLTRNNNKPYYVYLTVLRYLQERCNQGISRKTVAESFGLSPDYISHLFNDFHPVSFHEELIRLKLEMALRYLRQPLSINTIAKRCGFSETGYFIKVFRKRYGITPGAYRSNTAVQ